MELCQKILEQLDQGVPYQQIAPSHPWPSLSVSDRERLFLETEQRIRDPNAVNLLYALCLMTFEGKEPWDEVRALALFVAHPAIPLPKKQDVLKRMWHILGRITNTLSDVNPAEIHRYKRYEMDYYGLKAKLSIEEGKWAEAIRSYRQALAICHEYGNVEHELWLKQQIDHLQEIEKRHEQLVPLELLKSEHACLQAKVNDLTMQVKTQQQSLQVARKEAQSAQKQRDMLLQEVKDRREQ